MLPGRVTYRIPVQGHVPNSPSLRVKHYSLLNCRIMWTCLTAFTSLSAEILEAWLCQSDLYLWNPKRRLEIIVRLGDLTEVRAPWNRQVMADPALRLPGIYIARVVATLYNDVNKEISSGAHSSPRWSKSLWAAKMLKSLTLPVGNLTI
jgi:hypothetical protein